MSIRILYYRILIFIEVYFNMLFLMYINVVDTIFVLLE